MEPTHVVGTIAAALTILFAWPQAWRALRADHVEGISPVTSVMVLLTALSWLFFGILITDVPMMVANSCSGLAAACTVGVLIHRRAIQVPNAAIAFVCWLAVTFAAYLLLAENGVGIVGTVLGATMAIPQAWHVFREGEDGVSIATYLLLAGVTASWLVYGILIAKPVAVAPNVIALPAALLIVARTAWDRYAVPRRAQV